MRRLSAKKQQNEIIALCGGIIAILVIVALITYIRSQRKLHEANMTLFERSQNDLNTVALSPEATEKEINDTPAGGITPEHAAEIFSKVKNFLESSPEIYSEDFSMRTLATLINEPSYAVSAAINYCSGSNFKTLLLDYRLREACRRLSDKSAYNNQTIESIALGLGFKSRTYFNTVFKKHTGLTPAVYMNIAHSKEGKQTDNPQTAV